MYSAIKVDSRDISGYLQKISHVTQVVVRGSALLCLHCNSGRRCGFGKFCGGAPDLVPQLVVPTRGVGRRVAQVHFDVAAYVTASRRDQRPAARCAGGLRLDTVDTLGHAALMQAHALPRCISS
jgi:hypothetical protein